MLLPTQHMAAFETAYFFNISALRPTKLSVYKRCFSLKNISGEFFETLYCVNTPRRNISGTRVRVNIIINAISATDAIIAFR